MNRMPLAFLSDIAAMKQQYAATKRIDDLNAALLAFAEKYSDQLYVGDYLLNVGEEYFSTADRLAGMAVVTVVSEHFQHVNNQTGLCLRLAEHYIENSDTEKGTEYLIRLCTDTVINYEESIAFNELTPVWEKYKYLVDGKVPPSVPFHSAPSPLPPEKCTMQIHDILAQPREDILSALSEHLGQMSANGDCLNCLNKWEKTAFYADELCMEVNAGGFSGYLYYHGQHFEKAYRALETIGAAETLSLLEQVRAKFPRKRVPKSLDTLQNALDSMEETGIDFEDEDTLFCDSAEKELLNRLLAFVMQNANHFR